MRIMRLLQIVLLTTMASSLAYAQGSADPHGSIYHFAKARQIAGNDPYLLKWIEAGPLCKPPQVHRSMMEGARAPGVVTPRTPVQLFDNLYMVGNSYVVSLILKTSAGLVMFDTMNNAGDVRNLVEPGMAKLGLDPADIKYVVVTHGHGDHYGGAKYLQEKHRMPIGALAEDWHLMETSPFPTPRFDPPPARDRVLTDGQDVVIGDATIHIVKTPGHTPGVASSVFPVKDKGVTRNLIMWGGTAYRDTVAQHNSLHKLWDAGKKRNAVGMMNTHAYINLIDDKIEQMKTSSSNPLVLGEDVLDRLLAIQDECSLAQLAWPAERR